MFGSPVGGISVGPSFSSSKNNMLEKVVRVEKRYEIKVSELSKMTCKTEYEQNLKERLREGTRGSSMGVKEEWTRGRQFWRWERKCVGQRELGKE